MNTCFAPIVLFCYNRPEHTLSTLTALEQNTLSHLTTLYIFLDGPKENADEDLLEKIQRTREIARSRQWCKEVYIIEREKNIGLADSIILGVTEVVNKHGKVIVLEDDIVTSPSFLTFMNNALSFYENEKKIWHISGWNYPVSTRSNYDSFLWRVMNCWGWGTWADRWKFFEKNPRLLQRKFSKQDKKRFNLDNTQNFWSQVEANINGKINTWAIFWYATIFENEGLCLNPRLSYVKNIGHDGSGVHCGENDFYLNQKLNKGVISKFPVELKENNSMVREIKRLFRGKFFYTKKMFRFTKKIIKKVVFR